MMRPPHTSGGRSADYGTTGSPSSPPSTPSPVPWRSPTGRMGSGMDGSSSAVPPPRWHTRPHSGRFTTKRRFALARKLLIVAHAPDERGLPSGTSDRSGAETPRAAEQNPDTDAFNGASSGFRAGHPTAGTRAGETEGR